MYSLVRELETRPLTSFPAIFGEALAVGWLSRRRVYHEALKYEKDRSGGRLSPFGFSAVTAEVSYCHHQNYASKLPVHSTWVL